MKKTLLIPILVLLAAVYQPAKPATARQAATDTRPVILAFGDSLTAGFGVPPTLGYPEQLQAKLDALGYKYRVVNMGISGDTTNGGRARMSRGLLLSPAIVILEFGGNDSPNGLRPSQTEANFDQMIRTFQKAGATVILAGRGFSDGLSSSDDMYARLAERYHLPWIPNFLSGVSGDANLTIGDHHHPNAEGYAIVVTTVMKILEPHLKPYQSR